MFLLLATLIITQFNWGQDRKHQIVVLLFLLNLFKEKTRRKNNVLRQNIKQTIPNM